MCFFFRARFRHNLPMNNIDGDWQKGRERSYSHTKNKAELQKPTDPPRRRWVSATCRQGPRWLWTDIFETRMYRLGQRNSFSQRNPLLCLRANHGTPSKISTHRKPTRACDDSNFIRLYNHGPRLPTPQNHHHRPHQAQQRPRCTQRYPYPYLERRASGVVGTVVRGREQRHGQLLGHHEDRGDAHVAQGVVPAQRRGPVHEGGQPGDAATLVERRTLLFNLFRFSMFVFGDGRGRRMGERGVQRQNKNRKRKSSSTCMQRTTIQKPWRTITFNS